MTRAERMSVVRKGETKLRNIMKDTAIANYKKETGQNPDKKAKQKNYGQSTSTNENLMLKKLSNIPKDKLLHFFWGSILSFILILYCGIVGMIIALIIPAVKELYYDKYLGKGNCEWADYFYTIAPTIMLAIMRY